MSAELPYDEPMTPEEQAHVAHLTPDQLERIDQALKSNIINNWRKVARVVAETMSTLDKDFPSVPDIFYAQRIMALRDAGTIESQGNLRRMRYSEVRLPQNNP